MTRAAIPAGRPVYPDLDQGVSREVLARMDELRPCAEHWKILITAGMGFFADAYDLFIIGVAGALITVEWHIAGVPEVAAVVAGPAHLGRSAKR